MKRTSWVGLLALSFTTTVGAVEPREIPWSGPVGEPGGPHVPSLCVAPWGADLCAVIGVEAAYIMPYGWGYNLPAPMGSWWRPYFDGWLVNAPGGVEGLPLTYPSGYTPLHEDPALDFAAKVSQMRMVVDVGTPYQRVFVFDAPQVGLTTAINYWFAGAFGHPGMDSGTFVFFLHLLPPLPPGVHIVEQWYSVSQLHCDGFGSIFGEPIEDHCLLPGILYRGSRGRYEFAP